MVKTFESISDMIEDPNFVNFVSEGVSELRNKRLLRPMPGEGLRYKRDWYDRMTDAGGLTTDFFVNNIESIWNRNTSLSSELRGIIQHVCDVAVYKTHKFYEEIPEQTKEEFNEFEAMKRKPSE